MRYFKSDKANMRINEYAAKKQGRIDSGRDVVVGVNKYRIYKEDGDDGERNGNETKGGRMRRTPLALMTPP